MSAAAVAAASSKPFIQLVSFSAKDAENRQKLWNSWLPAFKNVRENEIGSITSTYEAFFPIALPGAALSAQPESSTEIVAFETYVSQAEFERVHMGAPVVKQFLSELDGVLARETALTFLDASGIGFHTRGAEREAAVLASGVKPLALVVTFTLAEPFAASLATLEELFAPLAKHVLDNEPNTLTYELFRSKGNPAEIVIFERYVQATDLTQIHWLSAPFLALGSALASNGIIAAASKRTYEEQQLGHWGRE